MCHLILDCEPDRNALRTITYKTRQEMNISLACPLFGFPSPLIKWRDPDGINYTTRFTNIWPLTVKKFGTYTCSGCNGEQFSFKLEDHPVPKPNHKYKYIHVLVCMLAFIFFL